MAVVVKDYPNYSVTKFGRVYSKRAKRFLSPRYDTKGYSTVCLGRGNEHRVHRLVLETFVGPCPKGMECRHLDGNPQNNNLDNLCWGTHSENIQDAIKHGTWIQKPPAAREKNLVERDARMMIYMYQTKLFTQQEIANIFGIDQSTVHYITSKKRWKHIWRN